MKRISAFLLGLVFSLTSLSLFADNTKIGVVDLQKILQSSSETRDIQDKLEKEFKPRRDKLVVMEEDIKRDMEKFKRDSAVLSASDRKALEKKIVTAQKKFESMGQQYQQELSAAHNQAMEGFYNKIRDAVAKVAKKDKYDLVLQKDAAPFSANNLDVTDDVMKILK